MKIIVSADWHLGMQKFPNPRLRMTRGLQAFEKFMDTYQNDYDLHIVAGDLFDKPDPSYELVNHVMGILSGKRNMGVILMQGNHDAVDEILKSPLHTLSMIDYGGDPGTEVEFVHTSLGGIIGVPIIMMSYQRDPDVWFECLEYHLKRLEDDGKPVYIICHQHFDCFFDKEMKEVIHCFRLVELFFKYGQDRHYHIVAGHLHKTDDHEKIDLVCGSALKDKVSFYSIGIPLQQSFSDVGVAPMAIAIDTEKEIVEHIELDICDSEFRETTHCQTDYPKNHFYRANIVDEVDELYLKTLIEKGYHIKANYLQSDDVPDKLDREATSKDYSPEDIIDETVKELGNDDKTLKDKGNELIKDKIPF